MVSNCPRAQPGPGEHGQRDGGPGRSSLRTKAEYVGAVRPAADARPPGSAREARCSTAPPADGRRAGDRGLHQGVAGQQEFFDADMYIVQITGFHPGRGVLTEPVRPAYGARLDVGKTDPADDRHVPALDRGGALFSTQAFTIENGGNRTLRAPKRSSRIILDTAGPDNRLAGMSASTSRRCRTTLRRCANAGLAPVRPGRIPAPRHAYAKVAFDTTYRGLFSVIKRVEPEVPERALRREPPRQPVQAGRRDLGCATLAYRTGPTATKAGASTTSRTRPSTPTGSRPTPTTPRRTPTTTSPASSGRSTASACRAAGTVRHRRLPGVGGRHHGRRGLPAVGGRQHTARELGRLLRHAVELLSLQLRTPGSGERLRQLALLPLHPVGLRQLPGDRLLRHPVAVQRHPRLGG